MWDLYAGFGIMALISTGCFYLSYYVGNKKSKNFVSFAIILTVTLLCMYLKFLYNTIYIVKLLPFSNVIVLGNWIPIFAFLLAGFAWAKIPGGKIRKSFYIVALISVALYGSYKDFFGKFPKCSNRWKDGVCLQTTPRSCAPACAATLLKIYGINSNEKEMAKLCLATTQGTSFYGLYRGLKLKTYNTKWKVEVFQESLESFVKNQTNPVIVRVGLPKEGNKDPRYQKKWGWIPGTFHTIIFFRVKPNGRPEMGDPAVGKECWKMKGLKVLWRSQGLRLVPR